MTRRKPPSDTGPDYDHRLEQARAESDQLKQAILDDVLGRVRENPHPSAEGTGALEAKR